MAAAANSRAPAPSVPGSTSGGVNEDSTTGQATPISALQAPQAQTDAEIVPHAGQSNRPDEYIYTNFVQLTSLSWTTAQLPGTLLYSTPIHPDRANPIIAYLTKIYNAWCGSLEYRVKIAGTGFHAGALAFVRVPPNIDPTTLTSPSDFTVFEWEFFDPKQLETCARFVMDQRNVMYHYRPLDITDRQTFGGYFCIYVLQQLNTSSTGINQISVNVWNRAGPDFAVSQIIPPSIANSISGPDYSAFTKLIDATSTSNPILDCASVTEIAMTILPVLSSGRYGCVNLNGEDVSSPYVPWLSTNFHHEPGKPSNHFGYPDGSIWTGRPLTMSGTAAGGQYTYGVSPTNGGYQTVLTTNSSYDLSESPFKPIVSVTDPPRESWCTNDVAFTVQNDLEPNFAPVGNESIVVFRSSLWRPSVSPTPLKINVDTMQTLAMIEILKSQTRPQFTADMALLFTLIHRQTLLPVAYMKLYPNGFFTTSKRTTLTLLKYGDYTLSFQGIIGRNDPVPNVPAVNANLLLIQIKNANLI